MKRADATLIIKVVMAEYKARRAFNYDPIIEACGGLYSWTGNNEPAMSEVLYLYCVADPMRCYHQLMRNFKDLED